QILTVAIRIIQQLIKDTRTLAFLLFAPVFVLGLLYVIMGSSSVEPNIGVIDLDDELQVAIEDEAHSIVYVSIYYALSAMRTQDIDAYSFMEDDKPYIIIDGDDITIKSAVIQAIQNALHTLQEQRRDKLKEDFEMMEDVLTPSLE